MRSSRRQSSSVRHGGAGVDRESRATLGQPESASEPAREVLRRELSLYPKSCRFSQAPTQLGIREQAHDPIDQSIGVSRINEDSARFVVDELVGSAMD